MTELSRRDLIVGAVVMTAAANLPAMPAAAVAQAPVIPAWAVGTPGEFNWQHIIARSAEQAERIFRNEHCDFECDEDSPCGECEGCTLDLFAERKPDWDGKVEVSSGDWLRSGSGSMCSRCSYETFPEEDGHAVGDEAVCSDCMTLADWDIVDPERAAEMRADALPDPVSGAPTRENPDAS